MPKDTDRETFFYESIIVPRLNKHARSVTAEVDYRLMQAKAVAMTVERERVRKLHEEIQMKMGLVLQGADPREMYHQLVDIVAERGGPTPFLSRMEAVMTIGKLAKAGKVVLDPGDMLGETLLKAMATEPFPRGGPILQGILEGVLQPIGEDRRKKNWKGLIKWDPDLQNEGEMHRWRRELMIAEVAQRFSEPEGFDLSMILPEWLRIQGEFRLAGGSHEDEENMRPKYVARLKELVRGIGERRMHICSVDMQLLAAVIGIPRNDQYGAGDFLDRNLSLVRGFPRLAMDEMGSRSKEVPVKVQGVLIEPLVVLEDARIEELEGMMEKFKGGLPYKVACERLPVDALSYVVAARALRKVRGLAPRAQRGRIMSAVETEIKRAAREVEVQYIEESQVVNSKQVTILGSYLGQFKRERRKPQVTEEQAKATLRVVAQGLLCTIGNSGETEVRPERDLLRLINQLISDRAVSTEDARHFPQLIQHDRFDVETIVRRSAPQGTRSPISFVRDDKD